MARTRTLAQLRADVCDRADITDGGVGAGRHPTETLTRRINQAIQQYMRLVTDAGADFYLKQSAVTTSTSSTVDANNWAPRDYLTLPSDFYHLVGIDITIGSSTNQMTEFARDERNIFKDSPSWLAANGVGTPAMYRLGGTNASGTRLVRVIPSADAAYSCVIWYLPIATDLSGDSDTFDGLAGFEEWVVNRAAMDSLLKDTTSELYQMLAAENARLQADMVRQFANAAGPGRRVDSRAARRRSAWYARGSAL